jgi:translation initiation factor IF-2
MPGPKAQPREPIVDQTVVMRAPTPEPAATPAPAVDQTVVMRAPVAAPAPTPAPTVDQTVVMRAPTASERRPDQTDVMRAPSFEKPAAPASMESSVHSTMVMAAPRPQPITKEVPVVTPTEDAPPADPAPPAAPQEDDGSR